MADTTWVIPCRFDPVVFDCVAAIRRNIAAYRVGAMWGMGTPADYEATRQELWS